MDFLQETIRTFGKEEEREFRVFIQRQRQKQGRKDLELFNLLKKDEGLKPKEIATRIYQSPKLNAYHTLRKRLVRELMDFVMLKRMDSDTSSAPSILGMMSMSQYLLDKGRPAVAWKYISKAEVLAIKSEHYDLLDNIINLQIKFADDLGVDLDELIIRWERNKVLANRMEKANMALSQLKQKLNKAKRDGHYSDLVTMTTKTISDIGLHEDMKNNASFMHLVTEMTRSAVIATKDYRKFEPYIIDIYTSLNKNSAFGKKNQFYRLSFLYMISHVLYRNRKMDEAEKYLIELGEKINDFKGLYYSKFYPKYLLLNAAVKSYNGKNEESIQVLNEKLNDKSVKYNLTERLNLRLNLAVYYFQATNFKKAIQQINSIGHTDLWCEKKMGKEWRFKKSLIEIIIQVELGNHEIALNRIRSVEKYFTVFLEHQLYQRAKTFMSFIKVLINNPEEIASKDFSTLVDQNIIRLPGDQEDIQAMTFYCWLKSKMVKRPYYEVLIETVREF